MSDLDQRIASLSPEKRELLLRRLNEQKKASRTPPASIPRRSQSAQTFPLSFAQESLWLIDQMTGVGATYNIPCVVRLQGPLNFSALEQSLQEMGNRHESLRTTFRSVEGHPEQTIATALEVSLSSVSLQHLPEAERMEHAWRYIDAEATQSFDLTLGPLLRTTLLRLAEEDHILLVLMHHIISDGWSIDIFLRELTALYEAFSAGRPSLLPELPIQYADYALWQRERLQGEELERLLAYWKQQLAGAPGVLEVPTDYPRPTIQTFHGAGLSFQLSPALAEQLRALSQKEQTSLFMTFLAAFQLLLSRYTRQEDIVVGSPTANRTRAETEGLIGYLVNMLVLRTDLSGNPSFRGLLRRVRAMALEAYAHQEYPFAKLVQALQPERSLSYSPLFQVTFGLENAAPSQKQGAGLTWQSLEPNHLNAKYDLDLTIHESQEGISGIFEYNTDLFEAATIKRMIGHLQTLLEGIAANPDQPIGSLPLLTPAEQQQLLVDWTATQAPYPKDQSVHQLFEQQAERSPNAVAVVYQGSQLTYRELNERANQLAHFLRKRGVGPDVLVGLCVERSLDMIVALLGILKAGGAYVPMDPTYPRDRLAFMLEDSQASVLVTQQALLSLFPQHHATVVCLDTNREMIAQESSANPTSGAQAEHLAYVIYTSGSTGKPKGVLIPHRALVNHNIACIGVYDLHPSDRVLQFASLSFDVAAEETFPTLLSGAALVLRPAGLALTPTEMLRLVAQERITVLNLPTAYWHTWVQELAHANATLPETLQLVAVGGEAALPQYLTLWQQHVDPRVRWWNGYGPTETTITATFYNAAEDGAAQQTTVPIGRPIANAQAYLLDTYLQPVPIGVPGELYIGGDGLARGYLNRPELTFERFIKHPFSAQPDARLYKTGDLARWRPDGNLEYIGRIDNQVKIRGFRIELGEIEAVLTQHPQVREAAVLAREDAPGEKRVVAYMVPQPGQSIAFKDIHAFLKEHLPEYMLPSAAVVLSAFPLTPNGKLDRKALPAPEAEERNGTDTYVAPTLIEHYQLVEIWEELLDTRPIGIKDNFFFLGGHSLLAMRLAARIEEVFGKKISMATLFTGPTIEEITDALQKQEEHQSRAPIFAVQSGGSRRPFFFMHGAWTGGGFYCYRLARDLGPDQPFYALQPYRMDGLPVPPSFEQMAREHLEAIRAIQPEGPYLLGGFCNGGLVAAEMARQLQQEGQTVELMVMVDPSEPARISQRLARSAIHALGAMFRVSEENQLDLFLRLRLPFFYIRDIYRYLRYPAYRKTAAKIREHRSWLGRAFPELNVLTMPTQQLREDWAAVYLWSLPGHIAEFSVDRVAFFWSKQEYTDDKGAWGTLSQMKTSENYTIPGWHSTWTAEKIRVLAEQLSACMSKTGVAAVKEEALTVR